jgi:hypothetical protein
MIGSCKQDYSFKPYSIVSIKFVGDESDIPMETINSKWSYSLKVAEITATGYKFEQFQLYLPNVTDTGDYTNLSINNISFTDGVDFVPHKFQYGFIHINYIDSISVSGYFKVSLEDDFNGVETRAIEGAFGIND